MKFEKYKKIFVEKAQNVGYSYENIEKCLAYAEPLITKQLPVIYNTSHLSVLVGYNKNYIKRAALSTPKTSNFYIQYTAKKKNGKIRELAEPLPSLKEIQHWILENILYKLEVSRFAKAYIPKKTIKEHVRFHKGQEIVLTMDLKNFFDSVKFDTVEQIFTNAGYSKLISNLLTKLCTLKHTLPQGAPTSPCLSNIIFFNLDKQISEYCISRKIKYTRYADDMAFSGSFDTDVLIDFVKNTVESQELTINEEKTLIRRQYQPQIICGIIVNEKVQVPKKKRNELRQAVFYIEKYGLESHLEKIEWNRGNYIKHLIGVANYILFINPKDKNVREYRKKLEKYR